MKMRLFAIASELAAEADAVDRIGAAEDDTAVGAAEAE
jgi:hypothetical protein